MNRDCRIRHNVRLPQAMRSGRPYESHEPTFSRSTVELWPRRVFLVEPAGFEPATSNRERVCMLGPLGTGGRTSLALSSGGPCSATSSNVVVESVTPAGGSQARASRTSCFFPGRFGEAAPSGAARREAVGREGFEPQAAADGPRPCQFVSSCRRARAGEPPAGVAFRNCVLVSVAPAPPLAPGRRADAVRVA